MSGCVCSAGFALKNGECVPEADCSSQDKSLETKNFKDNRVWYQSIKVNLVVRL